MQFLYNFNLKVIFSSLVCVIFSIILKYTWSTPFQTISNVNTSYDYIVVGGGTAGCVIASKLSELNKNVLLIEAGEEFNYLSKIPLTPTLMQRGSYDYSYSTVPQKYSSFGLENKVQFLPRGKGLGGTGKINYFLHGLGVENDYKNWNLRNWNYSEIKKFATKVFSSNENLHNQKTKDSHVSKKEYKINLSNVDENLSQITEIFIEATKQINLKSGNAAPFMNTIKNGERESTYEKYLVPNLTKNNLHILTKTVVTKINFKNDVAYSINLLSSNNKTREIFVVNEIVLSCGSIRSPQLLMLSGIGPEIELKKHNITVIKKLNGVGKNLHDHLNTPLYVTIGKPISMTLSKTITLKSIFDYVLYGKGFIASTGVTAFARGYDHSSVFLFAMGSADEKLLREIANTKEETFRAFFPYHNNISQEGIIFLASCLQPQSRGMISLNNTDPINPPLIDPKYLSNSNDVQCIISGIKLIIDLVNTPAFQSIGAKIQWPKINHCKTLWNERINDDYLECIIRFGALTGHHIAGTCSMAGDSSVVDEYLKVRGIRNLRIVDASILPTQISSPPNSVIIAMAEKAFTLILQDLNTSST